LHNANGIGIQLFDNTSFGQTDRRTDRQKRHINIASDTDAWWNLQCTMCL